LKEEESIKEGVYVSIGTVYGSDAALCAFSSISQQINLRSD
jgi:hypothetical protein